MGADFDDTTPPRRRRDSDEQGWSRWEKLVLAKLEDQGDQVAELRVEVRELGREVGALKLHRAQTVGADQVRGEIWRWVLRVLAGVVLAALLYLAGRVTR